jgi:hypothetical protein
MMKSLLSAVILALVLVSTVIAQASSIIPRAFGEESGTLVSAISSGAFMAVQYQAAYSNSVVGGDVVAAVSNYCVAGALHYTSVCMGQVLLMPANTALMPVAAEGFAESGQIGPLSRLHDYRIHAFSGTKDMVVSQQGEVATTFFLTQAGVTPANLLYVDNVPIGHALLTSGFGNSCADNALSYIGHCQVNKQRNAHAGAIFTHIGAAAMPPVKALSGRIVTLNQHEFADASTGMAEDAYLPTVCASEISCEVPVALQSSCIRRAAYARYIVYLAL